MGPIDQLAADHWTALLRREPVRATIHGVHDHDDRVGDLGVEAADARRTALLGLRQRLQSIVPMDDRERVVHGSLAVAIDEELVGHGGAEGAAVPHVLLACQQMTGPHTVVLRLMPNLTYPEPAHAAAVVARYRAVGSYLEQAADRFLEGVERGVTPVRRNVEHVLAQVDAFVEGPLEDDPLVAVAGPEAWDGEAAWRAELAAAVRDHVRPALRRYRERLATEQLPHGRDDEHAGLSHVDPSGRLYAGLARVHTTVDVDPEEVHRVGVAYVTGPLAAEWAKLGATTVGQSDPALLMDVLRRDPSLRFGSSQEVEQQARVAVERASSVMHKWFGRLPRSACVVEPVPAYLAPSSAPAYYIAPAPDGSRPGTYFVNSLDATSMLRIEGEATAFHEAIPGHHLQLAISAELEDVPDFMRLAAVTAYAEGWGLYAERLADEMGLYSSDVDRLGILALDAFRASRLVVDTGLHALGWSRQRAIDWMVDHTPLPQATIASEVDRYLAMPGQALAYKLGQLEISRLRAEAEARLGDRFDIRAFHDAVLGQGMVSLPVLADVVERWTAAGAGV